MKTPILNTLSPQFLGLSPQLFQLRKDRSPDHSSAKRLKPQMTTSGAKPKAFLVGYFITGDGMIFLKYFLFSTEIGWWSPIISHFLGGSTWLNHQSVMGFRGPGTLEISKWCDNPWIGSGVARENTDVHTHVTACRWKNTLHTHIHKNRCTDTNI